MQGMSEKTIIAWTDHTFNIAWGCVKVSPGCKNCYADTLSRRYGHDIWGPNKSRRVFGEKHWRDPLKWNTEPATGVRGPGLRQLVFSSSMCDWAEDHPQIAAEREKLWPLIRATPNLEWQLLTKRADRIAGLLPPDWGNGYPNVWLGVSVENIDWAWRADCLKEIPAAVRFISYEPALGPLDDLDLRGLDWIIYGGESGAKYREHNLDWPRAMRKKCAEAGAAFFYKQSAAFLTERGTQLDGETVRHFPIPRVLGPCQSRPATAAKSQHSLSATTQPILICG
jgi:protein gp37